MNNPKKINLALVGYGKWGKKILSESKKLANARIKYVCSPRINKAKLFHEIPIDSYKKIAEFSDVDGVVIATPPTTHFEIASFFIKRNYNIFIEKPITSSFEEAEILKKFVENSDSVVSVGHIYLFNHAFKKAVKIMRREKYKEITVKFSDSQQKDWRDLLWEWGPHVFSIMDLILNGREATVERKILQSGKQLYIEVRTAEVSARIYLGGFKRKTRKIVFSKDNSKLILDETKIDKLSLHEGVIRKIEYSHEPPLVSELQSFAYNILHKKNTRNELELGVRTVKILERLSRDRISRRKQFSL